MKFETGALGYVGAVLRVGHTQVVLLEQANKGMEPQ